MKRYKKFERHTLEKCIEVAKPYTLLDEFRKEQYKYYRIILYHGWESEALGHLIHHRDAIKKGLAVDVRVKVSDQDCAAKAKLCKIKREFATRFPEHYYAAKNRKIISKICSHMISRTEELEIIKQKKISEIVSYVKKNKLTVADLRIKNPSYLNFIYSHKLNSKIPFAKSNRNHKVVSDEELAKTVNNKGCKNKDPFLHFCFVKTYTNQKLKRREILVRNPKTGTEVSCPLVLRHRIKIIIEARLKRSQSYIKHLINSSLGKKSRDPREHFIFVKLSNNYKVVIYNKFLNKKKTISWHGLKKMSKQPFSLQKENPFLYYKESVNKIGLSSSIPSEHFELIAVSTKRWKNIPQIMVSIRNLQTKQVKTVHIQSINKGHNPFNSHQEYHEREVVQPKVERFLKRNGFKKITKEECGWQDFSTPDIIAKNKEGYLFVVEVKSHLKVWNRKHIENQRNKYDKLARKFFGEKYLGIKLVCLKGKYGEKLTKKLFKF